MSDKQPPIKTENEPYKSSEYFKFIQWFALPMNEREEIYGCKTQAQFAMKYDVHPDTLSDWKKRDDFDKRIQKIRDDWGREHTGSVFAGWRNSCVKGNPYSIELWLSYFLGWDKTQIVKQVQEFTKEDLLTLIKVLPENKQQQFYDTVNKIIIEANEIAHTKGDNSESGKMEGKDECGSEKIKPTQTDKLHEDKSADNEVAEDIQENVCDSVDGQNKENNNQGTERRGEK